MPVAQAVAVAAKATSVGAVAAAIASLTLGPFGHLSQVMPDDKIFYGFDPQNAVLTLVRAQKIEIPKCDGSHPCSCQRFSDALISQPLGLTPQVDGDFKAWEPWKGDDLDKVKDCDHFGCDVKLDEKEAKAMKSTPEKDRLAEYLSLIDARVKNYKKTEARNEYEFPGAPVDPWRILGKIFSGPALPPISPNSIFLRILDFSPGKIQKMHQVVDRRSAVVSLGEDASDTAVWLRDAYTDHYFDSWGEYTEVICDGKEGELLVLSSLLGEMDMLKKTGFIAALTRPKLRNAFLENGKVFLNTAFEKLKARAAELPEIKAPVPSPSPLGKS